jgi:hypothetical protein
MPDVLDVVAYASISLVATARARRKWRRKDTRTWDRDTSTR